MGSATEERKRRIKGFISGYLFESGALTAKELDAALERQLELAVQGIETRLGEVLVQTGAVTQDQLAHAQALQRAGNPDSRPEPGGSDVETGSR